MKRALVTGGDGLLGSHLVRQLLNRSIAVRVLVQPGATSPTLEGLDLEQVAGDLTDQATSLVDAVHGCDYVFHCAAITALWESPDRIRQVNLEATRRLLDACLVEPVQRFVFVGSASSFAPGTLQSPGDEGGDFPKLHQSVPYMESKHEAMGLVQRYVAERGLDAVIVAPTFMLGDHDWRPSSGELVRQFVRWGLPMVPAGGRSFAYAPDVAAAMIAALDRGQKGEVYLLGGANLTYLDFFGKVARLAGITPPRGIVPAAALQGAGVVGSVVGRLTGNRKGFNRTLARLSVCDAYYSSAKAIDALGYAQTPVETGIRETLQGLMDHGHLPAGSLGDLVGKVALITGASRGVGFATARALVERGVRVAISARGEERLHKAQAQLTALGGEVLAVTGDVGCWEDAERMVTQTVARFGRLDLLVANAGVSMRGRFDQLSPEVCSQTIHTNLMGTVYTARAAAAQLMANRGHLVMVSSIAGLMGLPGASTYCASKGALTGLCESLRLELGPKGVHCGVVYLGFTEHDPEKRILAADGSLVLPDRPAHHTQAYAASLILDLIEQRKRQVIMTPVGQLGGVVHRLSPTFVEWAILKAQASQWKMFQQFS
jgi:dihydroflavonol-4-reductase